MAEVDYQKAGQVRQALNERELGQAYGNDGQVKAADKRLAELGYVEEKPAKVAKDEAPTGRAAKQSVKQQTTAKADEE